MADLAFGKEIELPAGALRRALSAALPLYVWTCGEDDDGSADCAVPFRRSQLIMGRSAGMIVTMTLEPGWPAAAERSHHVFTLALHHPTTEDRDLAERMLAVTALALCQADREGSQCRFEGGPWLDNGQVEQVAEQVMNGKGLPAAIAAFGPVQAAVDGGEPSRPEQVQTPGAKADAPPAAPEPARAPFVRRAGGFGRKGL
ncbi:hypothetical protein FHS61_001360 [Altererythrobacter atlanticus]|uniref:Uncharacterized protein n=1 Tax=Croceibacterium atlanticum TaxID=1267766 RepID=A0A0F7KWF2_9SPHN|nr:hypothetical protein [Croceibacterium atlanticum]AKH44044.1 hypothetical protein WYH_03024 [Croceibacterium atlanticum]MBB5732351.1 hypothetical protein [Croceibacterium atlanticum]